MVKVSTATVLGGVKPDGTTLTNITTDELLERYQNGELHRVNGPAVINADGTQEWYQNGNRHMDNGLSLLLTNGTKYWHKNGTLIKMVKQK